MYYLLEAEEQMNRWKNHDWR